jgi:hypothetical protein
VVVANDHRTGYKIQAIFIQAVKCLCYFLKIANDVVTFEAYGKEIAEHSSR